MSRTNFFETIAVPTGPGGSLVPLSNIAFTPYTVNDDQSQGDQANAYADRTSDNPGTIVSDATGTVSYWLENGDYDIVVSDLSAPARINGYSRGFSGAVLTPDAIMDAALNAILFTGDFKFTAQTGDHGLNGDAYEWLMIVSDQDDGGGRRVQQNLYPDLWNIIGRPAVDTNGNFRLPNISGRTLIASGLATGLNSYKLWDMLGEEAHQLITAELAVHSHNIEGADTGIEIGGAQANITIKKASGLPLGNRAVVTNPTQSQETTETKIASAGVASGNDQWVPVMVPYGAIDWGGGPLDHTHPTTQTVHAHAVEDPGHGHACDGAGANEAHNNIQPSTSLNLFIKT